MNFVSLVAGYIIVHAIDSQNYSNAAARTLRLRSDGRDGYGSSATQQSAVS